MDESRKSLVLFNKDFDTFVRDWNNVGKKWSFTNPSSGETITRQFSGNTFDKIGTLFHSNDYNSLNEYNKLVQSGIKLTEAYKATMLSCSEAAKKNDVQIAKNVAAVKSGVIPTNEASEANSKLVGNFSKMSISSKAAEIAMQGLTMAANALAVALVMKGLEIAIQQVDNYVHRLEKAKEAAEDAKETYDETASKFESLNDEMKTTQSRMDELEAKDHLTFVEQEELDNLKATSAELEQQIELYQALKNMQGDTARDKAVDYFGTETNTKRYDGWVPYLLASSSSPICQTPTNL